MHIFIYGIVGMSFIMYFYNYTYIYICMTIYCIYPIFGVEVNEGNEGKKGKEDIVECARLYFLFVLIVYSSVYDVDVFSGFVATRAFWY